ncbi:hypothetical protein PIB30_078216, partial [Stylosanthes scabra]|nr:hypothetical protein [Stylosanthes scabra]
MVEMGIGGGARVSHPPTFFYSLILAPMPRGIPTPPPSTSAAGIPVTSPRTSVVALPHVTLSRTSAAPVRCVTPPAPINDQCCPPPQRHWCNATSPPTPTAPPSMLKM